MFIVRTNKKGRGEICMCDGRLEENILVVGQTECWKTTFIQKLAINNLFGNFKSVEWISQIKLSKAREAEIESCFKVKSHYTIKVGKFEEVLFHMKKS